MKKNIKKSYTDAMKQNSINKYNYLILVNKYIQQVHFNNKNSIKCNLWHRCVVFERKHTL